MVIAKLAEECGEVARAHIGEHEARDDDADVGLVHAPAELAYQPLTEPIVDLEATLDRLVSLGRLRLSDADRILAHSRSVFFAERSLEHVVPPALEADREALLGLIEAHGVQQKQQDALELVARLRQLPDSRVPPPDFVLAQSPMWRRRLGAIAAGIGVTLA